MSRRHIPRSRKTPGHRNWLGTKNTAGLSGAGSAWRREYRLAHQIYVPQMRISQICAGKRAITADTALRLSRAFGTTPGFWLALQSDYDTAEALRAHGEDLSRIQPLHGRRPATSAG